MTQKNSDKPLVTMAMMTYNQEKYVRDAVRGMLAQTYEPLEIIFSDDSSSDTTWKIMCEEVAANKGLHRNIVLRRNDTNLGILRHFERLANQSHGQLVVVTAGDDISLPDRISCMVDEWIADGRRAKLIHCGVWRFNEHGIFGEETGYSALYPRGACAAYAADVFTSFPAVSMSDAYEDRPYAFRALILGPELKISDKLVMYREGTGVSTSITTSRHIKSVTHAIAGIEQNRTDLQYAVNNGLITGSRYKELSLEVEKLKYDFTRRLIWMSGKTVRERWANRPCTIRRMFGLVNRLHLRAILPIVEMMLVVLPFRMGFPILDLVRVFIRFAQGIQYKLTKRQNLPSQDFLKRGDGHDVHHG